MKTNPAKPPGYESKPASYFEQARADMLPFVPPDAKRVLDVGCGRGNFGELLKSRRKLEVWGIEPVAAPATEAATKLDRVIEGIFAPEADLPPASFDAIFFNNVLEHLFDPAAALRLAHSLLNANGVGVASIPNIRQFSTLWEIVVQGEWRYADSGIMDRTHLRFFTKKSIATMFAEGGFKLDKLEGINPNSGGTPRKWLAFKILNGLTFKAIEDMRFTQFAVVAHPLKKQAGQA